MLEDYYRWLVDLLGDDDLKLNYQKLLRKLFDTEFTWIVDFDSNRAIDGLYLREIFARDIGWHGTFEKPCSVLEMMIALAMRCEDLIYDPNIANSVYETFMDMLYNSSLDLLDDDHYIESRANYIFKKILNREYDSCGNGSFFCVGYCDKDFRVMDLWWQANKFLDEKYRF